MRYAATCNVLLFCRSTDLSVFRWPQRRANVSFRVPPVHVIRVSRLTRFARHVSVGGALADVNPGGKRSKFIRAKNKIAKYICFIYFEMAALHYSSSSRKYRSSKIMSQTHDRRPYFETRQWNYATLNRMWSGREFCRNIVFFFFVIGRIGFTAS